MAVTDLTAGCCCRAMIRRTPESTKNALLGWPIFSLLSIHPRLGHPRVLNVPRVAHVPVGPIDVIARPLDEDVHAFRRERTADTLLNGQGDVVDPASPVHEDTDTKAPGLGAQRDAERLLERRLACGLFSLLVEFTQGQRRVARYEDVAPDVSRRGKPHQGRGEEVLQDVHRIRIDGDVATPVLEQRYMRSYSLVMSKVCPCLVRDPNVAISWISS